MEQIDVLRSKTNQSEAKKKGRPSKQDNIVTKNAFAKKEDDIVVPIVEVPPTAPPSPNTSGQIPIDMPKPKKERSAAQIETTKKMLEANKLKKANKTIIIIKEEPVKVEPVKVEPKVEPVKVEPVKPIKVKPVKPVKPVKVKPVKKVKKEKKVKYVSSSESETETDSSEEEKYIKKVTRKLELVNSIDARLKQNAIPRTKYSNLSIFS